MKHNQHQRGILFINLHNGHSGFSAHHSLTQSQQNKCPHQDRALSATHEQLAHPVAVVAVMPSRHRVHDRWLGGSISSWCSAVQPLVSSCGRERDQNTLIWILFLRLLSDGGLELHEGVLGRTEQFLCNANQQALGVAACLPSQSQPRCRSVGSPAAVQAACKAA